MRERETLFNKKLELLVNEISKTDKIAVFTGAGVSTLSGIPDFKGKHGVYNSPWLGYSVEEILSINFFRRNPEIFYKWAMDIWFNLESYEPNIVHNTLAKMEESGLLKLGVFTQNIDFLHQRAGSKNVFELHGSNRHLYCTTCNAFYTYEEIAPIVKGGKVPRCTSCDGIIKPDIVFYGESLNATVLKAAEVAFSSADLVLVLGSSLTVYPAASFPLLAKSHGGKLVIVNAQKTQYDNLAYLCFSDLEQTFTALNGKLFL